MVNVELTSLTVRRYRSIERTEKLPLGPLTILIGPNNEGKSNILRALVVGMRILSQARPVGVVRGQYRSTAQFQNDYNWARDFPLALQEKSPNGESVFEFEFQLDSDEIADFQREVRSALNGTLPIRLLIGQRKITFQVVKRGPGAKALTEKRDAIVDFLSSRIQLEYIPAVRTAAEATRVVGRLVEAELARLEDDASYINAVAMIERAQAPVL